MEVEVPITPMLDMAFQLLTFFILTYRPAPIEGKFSMNLLPAQKATEISKEQPKDAQPSIDASLRTLKTVLRAGENGLIAEITLADKPIQNLDELRKELEAYTSDPILSFDQAVLEVDPQLKNSEFIRVVDLFSTLKPKPLTKISFKELGQVDMGGPQ